MNPTPPNTELKSAEEWLTDPSNKARKTEQDVVDWIRSIQHNAMLHAAEIVIKSSTDNYGSLSYCKDLILTRAEQILKGEK